MSTSPRVALDAAREILARAQEKIDRLRNVEPYLIDLSLRENAFGARVGQTLQDKLQILPRLREFGFQNILLGTLDYAMPDELEVDDDFTSAVVPRRRPPADGPPHAA